MQEKVRPKKNLGQHFLTDVRTAERIAHSLTGYGDYKDVLEIGPGTGMLTRQLKRLPYRLVVSEVDTESVKFLQEQTEFQGLEIAGDFLSLNPTEWFDTRPFALIGNYPYNISTEIVFRMLEFRDQIPEMSGMFQKEVAQRFCASPGNKDYGITSVLVQAFYKAEYLFTVSEGVFNPPPKVKSGVLRLQRREHDLTSHYPSFSKVVKTAFNQRRKMLSNSLKPLLNQHSSPQDLPYSDKRPEQLSVEAFEEIRIWLESGRV